MKRFLRVLGLVAGIGILVAFVVVAALTARVKIPGEETVPAGDRRNQAVYVKMRDGVEIAVDVWLPPDLQKDERVPVLMDTTRYWRAKQIRWGARLMAAIRQLSLNEFLDPQALFFSNRHFAVILVDARGSGASGGNRTSELSPDEVTDLGELAAWAAHQPWSNGRVGTYGVSYDGGTAELALASTPSGVRAAVPLFVDQDIRAYTWPGGVLSKTFLSSTSAVTSAMDRNDVCGTFEVAGGKCLLTQLEVAGVKPVDADPHGKHLAELVARRQNMHVDEQSKSEFWDDAFPTPKGSIRFSDISAYGHRSKIEASGAPMQVWCGWLDLQICEGVLIQYMTLKNPQEVIIGPLSHGGYENTDPFATNHGSAEPPIEEQYRMQADFFDRVLRGDQPQIVTPSIRYYTMGEGQWHTVKVWPPEGFVAQRYYLGEDHTLSFVASQSGNDKYTVDFTASTGDSSRWYPAYAEGDGIYPDRSEEDKKLLTYTSQPLESDVEITGSPATTLYFASTTSDGAIHAYLEDVSPEGRVTYLDEGIFRVIHRRRADPATLPYQPLGPPHSFLRKDAQPLLPGELAEIQFSFYPTSLLLKKGHRIRLALAGADAPTFQRYPTEGTPTWTVFREAGHASFLELPIKTH